MTEGLFELTDEEKKLQKQGQAQEQQFKEQIPEEYYPLIQKAETELAPLHMAYMKSVGEHIILIYNILLKTDIPPESIRKMIVGRFIKYRAENTIRKYIPDEIKDQAQRERAKCGNAKRRAERQELMRQPIEEAFIRKGLSSEQAKESANDPAIINEALINYRVIGAREGQSPEERRRLAANMTADEELGESKGIQTNVEMEDIIGELPPPNEGTVESIQSIRISNLWKKSQKAYFTIDRHGNITNVFASRKDALEARSMIRTKESPHPAGSRTD